MDAVSGFAEAMLVFLIGATAIRTDERSGEPAPAEADPTDRLGGVADDETVGRNVAGDDGAGTDERMAPDGDPADERRVGTERRAACTRVGSQSSGGVR